MTCIAAVAHDGQVFMAADSLMQNDWLQYATSAAQPKVFRVGALVVGVSGPRRFANIMRHFAEEPEREDGDTDLSYMIKFAEAVREAVVALGYAGNKDGSLVLPDCSALIGYRGAIYVIDCTLAVGTTADGYCATGGGAEVALGALSVTGHLPPRERLLGALRAAVRHSRGVGEPFVFMAERD